MLSALAETEVRFRRSSQQGLLLETVLIRFALMERMVELEDVLRAMGDGGGAVPESSGGGGGRRPRPEQPAPRTHAQAEPVTARDARRGTRDAGAAEAEFPSPQATLDPRPTPPDPLDGIPTAASPRRTSRVPLPAELAERWDDVVAAAREVRPFLGTALEHALPTAVNARGEVMLELDAPDEIARQAIAAGAGDVAQAIGRYFDGITRVRITAGVTPADAPGVPRRYTAEEVRAERIAILRRRDPTLSAAIDALELEMLE
jgi:DNA polymerase-3 subunit gamma/tau